MIRRNGNAPKGKESGPGYQPKMLGETVHIMVTQTPPSGQLYSQIVVKVFP